MNVPNDSIAGVGVGVGVGEGVGVGDGVGVGVGVAVGVGVGVTISCGTNSLFVSFVEQADKNKNPDTNIPIVATTLKMLISLNNLSYIAFSPYYITALEVVCLYQVEFPVCIFFEVTG